MNEERLLLALYDRWCLVMNGDEAALRILRAQGFDTSEVDS